MLPQRARVAESRVKNKSSNGPPRVQSNVGSRRVFCNVWAYVSCREYVGTPQRCTVQAVKQGGIADLRFVLDRKFDSVRGDFLFPPKQETDQEEIL